MTYACIRRRDTSWSLSVNSKLTCRLRARQIQPDSKTVAGVQKSITALLPSQGSSAGSNPVGATVNEGSYILVRALILLPEIRGR
jgi:hypothetical protein